MGRLERQCGKSLQKSLYRHLTKPQLCGVHGTCSFTVGKPLLAMSQVLLFLPRRRLGEVLDRCPQPLAGLVGSSSPLCCPGAGGLRECRGRKGLFHTPIPCTIAFIYLFTAQAALAPEAGNVCRPAALPKQAGSANT